MFNISILGFVDLIDGKQSVLSSGVAFPCICVLSLAAWYGEMAWGWFLTPDVFPSSVAVVWITVKFGRLLVWPDLPCARWRQSFWCPGLSAENSVWRDIKANGLAWRWAILLGGHCKHSGNSFPVVLHTYFPMHIERGHSTYSGPLIPAGDVFRDLPCIATIVDNSELSTDPTYTLIFLCIHMVTDKLCTVHSETLPTLNTIVMKYII